jgi:glycosyltransferase involved in cell wall biosynthesis
MFHKAGIRRYSLELIKNLSSVDQTNQYIIYLSSKPRTDKIENLTSNFNTVYLEAPLFSLREHLILIYHLRKDKLDVFHTTFDFGVPLWPIRNVVVTVHDVFFGPDTFFRNYKTRFLYQLLTRYSVGKSSNIIVVSDFIKQKLLKYVPQARRKIERIKVIPNGVSPEFFPDSNTEESEKIKVKYKIRGKYILCVGSFASRIKNLQRVLQAYCRLTDEFRKNYQLVIIGEILDRVPEALSMIKELKSKNSVLCLGYVSDEDLPPLYRSAEVFIYPSIHEGFGIPVLEAMACGTPVVTSNITAMPEIAGEAALFVNPYDVDEMRDVVAKVLSSGNLRNELSQKGIERVKKFSWFATARKTLDIYQELFNEKYHE